MRKALNRIVTLVLAMVIIASTLVVNDIDVQAVELVPGQAYAWGIDVSAYQKDINWAQVKASGCSFAIIRAYTSKSGLDPYFIKNVNEANAVGIKTGAYVYSYATSVDEAVAEANNVIAILDHVTVTFPVCFDIEDKKQAKMSPEQMAAVCTAFCSTIDAAGYQSCVYSSKSWFTSKIAPIPYDKWVAQWNTRYNYAEVPCIWQQTSDGSVPGIAGRVDVDYIFKDYSYIVPVGFSTYGGYTFLYNNYRRQKGFVDFAGNRYFCNPVNFVVMTGWIDLGGAFYYMGTDGAMQYGFQLIDGAYYYFGQDGVMVTGLQTIADNQYLFGVDGKLHTGWFNSGTAMYYFNPENGAMQKGWAQIAGKTYCFNNDGSMMFGLQAIGQDKYFFDGNGVLQTGLVNAGGANYYFNPADGKMQTGIINIDGKYYYFDPNTAAMTVGPVKMNDGTRYFDYNTGAMTTGFAAIGDKRYYFDPTTGLMAYGVIADAKGIAYMDPKDGHQVVGLLELDGTLFYIDPKTGYLLPNAQVQVDNHIYVTDANGIAIMVQ